jgi:hypothetical protein
MITYIELWKAKYARLGFSKEERFAFVGVHWR